MPKIEKAAFPVALVTGGSRGIGEAVVRTFAEAGYAVAINCSSEKSLETAENLAAEVAKVHGVETKAVCADVSSFQEVAAMVAEVQAMWGRIDVLVNNAGITRDGLLARMSEEAFDRVIDVNLKGAFNCVRHVAPIMMKQRYGRIVSVSSVVGLFGNAGQVNYSASKAGIIGLTKSVAKELAARGITANAVAPGFIGTEMTKAMGEKAIEAVRGRIAMKEFGEPQDVANAVRYRTGFGNRWRDVAMSNEEKNNGFNRVVITGMGAISPAGFGVDALWSKVASGECCFTLLPEEKREQLNVSVVGAIPDYDPLKAGFSKKESHEQRDRWATKQ